MKIRTCIIRSSYFLKLLLFYVVSAVFDNVLYFYAILYTCYCNFYFEK